MIANVLIVRGARAVVIGLAVAWLAYIFRETTTMIGNSESVERVIQGVLNGIIVLLIADLIWQLAKAYIEYPAGTQPATAPVPTNSPAAADCARCCRSSATRWRCSSPRSRC